MGHGRVNRGSQRRAHLLETAEERYALRESRTPQQQLDVLDRRLGLGVGAAKERARLVRMIETSSKPKTTKSTAKSGAKKNERAKDRRKREKRES